MTGTPVCSCEPGFTPGPAEPTTCLDVDECALNNGGCDALTLCTNSTGSFGCGPCPEGYSGTGSTGCIPIACSGAPAPGCACLRVAPDGDDALGAASGGISPFESVQSAVDFALAHPGLAQDVCVAGGSACSESATFGPVVMRDGVWLYGNYESTEWTRCADGSLGTTLDAGGAGESVLFDAGIASETRLDGFIVSAPGIRLDGALGAKLVGLRFDYATTSAANATGIRVLGNADGLEVRDSWLDIVGSGAVTGILAESCAGSMLVVNSGVTAVNYSMSGSARALSAAGTCELVITDNSLVSQGGDGVDNTALACSAPCVVRGNPAIRVEKAGEFNYTSFQDPPFRGAAIALACTGCAEVSANTISNSVPIGPRSPQDGAYRIQSGYAVTGASITNTPLVARNEITSGCGQYSVGLDAAGARLENNSVRSGCMYDGPVLRTLTSVALRAGPSLDVHSNLLASPSPYITPSGKSTGLEVMGYPLTVRNNIIGGNGAAVEGFSGVFQHNNVLPGFAPGQTADALNGFPDSAGNFPDECSGWNAHILADSPCRDTGTPAGAPSDDFDGELRDAFPDVGPDEYSVANDPCGNVTCGGHGACGYVGTPFCTCDTGYWPDAGDPLVCIPNLCMTDCDPHALCQRNGNEIECGPCLFGYVGTPETGCVLDACATANGGCDPLVTCTNTSSGPVCGACPTGYSGSGDTACTDIDECATDNGGCDPLTACTNSAGGHACGACPTGYEPGSAGCEPDGSAYATVSVGYGHACAVRTDGRLLCWGNEEFHYGSARPGETFDAVAAGYAHTTALRRDGTVVSWGRTASYGTFEAPPGTFQSISAEGDYSCGVHAGGAVECWGEVGAVFTDVPSGSFSAVSVGGTHACALSSADSTLLCWGDDTFAQASPPGGAFAAVSASSQSTCGVRADGSVECWGREDIGGWTVPPMQRFSALDGGGHRTCGLHLDGSIDCWGNYAAWETKPPSGSFFALGVGQNQACAIRTDGAVLCWGTGSWNDPLAADSSDADECVSDVWGCDESADCSDELGGRTCACSFGSVRDGFACTPVGFTALSSGGLHTCALADDQAIVCWGGNYSGQSHPPGGAFQAVGASGICGLRPDGTLECWAPMSFGTPYPPDGTYAALPNGLGFSACAIKTDGSLGCWGSNNYGQTMPPTGTYTRVAAAYNRLAGVRTDGSLEFWGEPGLTNQSGPFTDVALGEYFACAIRDDGSLACFGVSSASPPTPPAGTFEAVVAQGHTVCALGTDGTISCWGDNTSGQASPPDGEFVALSLDIQTGCALTPAGGVTCWGNPAYGPPLN